ncbi:hypothetical protein GJ672_09140 [Spiribacter sp. 2438]|uniref:hypothetical protein n=1 Tax=Spiribacter sp. 2438 TaxID=2666185 RepID=UPI0012B09A1C|nr:hypothetical protein [Spiribacter sp. 2438]QGM22398.1 hypothetical protein GJ672_09140 [Spiribacter sp. 2438]
MLETLPRLTEKLCLQALADACIPGRVAEGSRHRTDKRGVFFAHLHFHSDKSERGSTLAPLCGG